MALTPDEQAARDAGWTMPEGDDLISDGDDAIRANAVKAVSEFFRNSGTPRTDYPTANVSNWHGILRAGTYQFPTQTFMDQVTGLPLDALPGNLVISPVGSTTSLAEYREFGEDGRRWQSTISSAPTNVSGWNEMTRSTRFGTALTCAQGSAVSTATDVGHALPYTPGARVGRWRLHFRNYNERSGVGFTDPVDFFGISVGEMDVPADGSLSGNWRADGPKKNIVPGGVASTPGSSEYITPWVDDFPLEAHTDYVIRYGYTCSPQQNHLGQGGGWSLTGGSLAINSDAPAMTQVQQSPLDVWIEGYTAAGVKVIAGYGDSLTVGQSATFPVYDSWLSRIARAQGAMPMFYAHSGTAYSEWTNPLAWKFNKYNNEVFYRMTLPSVLYCAMGSNDVFASGATLEQMIARFDTALPLIKEKTTQNVVFTTVLPRHDPASPQETVRQQWNDWLRENGPRRGLFVVEAAEAVTAPSGDRLDTRWAASSSDIHLNTAGYARIAAAIMGQDANAAQEPRSELLADRLDALEYDSGPRSLNALVPGRASGNLRIRRLGRWVILTAENLVMSAAGSGAMVSPQLPSGWRPVATQAVTGQGLSSRIQVTSPGNIQAYSWTTAPIYATVIYPTDENPGALVGDPL